MPRRLLALGLTLLAEADGLAGREAAILFRGGLLIVLLAARPLRLGELAGLRVGTGLQPHGAGWRIVVPREGRKAGPTIDVPVPARLAAPFERYLTVHRPILLGGRDDDHLWIGVRGNPMRPAAIYQQITRLTRRHLGVAVNPHLFRDCAATSTALEDPACVMIAKAVLGHASPRTAERYYNQARSFEAARAWQSCLRALRCGERPRRSGR